MNAPHPTPISAPPLPEASERSTVVPPLAAVERNSWQPIETAPKDGTWFLAWNGEAMFVAGIGREGQFRLPVGTVETELGEDEPPPPTHWMPLPAPPEQGK